jgi:hypothetical protein
MDFMDDEGRMMRLDPVSLAIREQFIIKSACVDDALSRAARDLYAAHQLIWELERRLDAAQRQASHGYLRRPPEHPARQPRPEKPAVTDDWIATGRES